MIPVDHGDNCGTTDLAPMHRCNVNSSLGANWLGEAGAVAVELLGVWGGHYGTVVDHSDVSPDSKPSTKRSSAPQSQSPQFGTSER